MPSLIVSQKVACIDASSPDPELDMYGLTECKIYIVRWVGKHPERFWQLHDTLFEEISFTRLVEIDKNTNGLYPGELEPGYSTRLFAWLVNLEREDEISYKEKFQGNYIHNFSSLPEWVAVS